MNNLLAAVNLAYNPNLSSRQRLNCARNSEAPVPQPCEAVQAWYARAQAWLQAGPNRCWLSLAQPCTYPVALLNLPDPPLILFLEGNPSLLHARAVGVVGSRNATRTGLANAHAMAQGFAQEGWVVVSGLAEGIDGAAHEGALAAQGATIAVLGAGLDDIYPKHHLRLAQRIVAQGGLMVSEYPPGTAPQPAFFPRRNRIIAGLADALLVVEATLRSGSLITARIASQLGRLVYAMPGSIHSSQSKGCNAMIKNGAMLAETVPDVLRNTLAGLPPHKQPPACHQTAATATAAVLAPAAAAAAVVHADLGANLRGVLAHLGQEPLHVDILAKLAKHPADDVLAALAELELMGLALCEAGGRWVKDPAA